MSDLHARLLAELDRRETIARTCEEFTPSPWQVSDKYSDTCVYDAARGTVAAFTQVYPECAISLDDDDARHIALHDPADALRRYARDRRLLERHTPDQVPANIPGLWSCNDCSLDSPEATHYVDWPCDVLVDLAAALNIPLEEPTDA